MQLVLVTLQRLPTGIPLHTYVIVAFVSMFDVQFVLIFQCWDCRVCFQLLRACRRFSRFGRCSDCVGLYCKWILCICRFHNDLDKHFMARIQAHKFMKRSCDALGQPTRPWKRSSDCTPTIAPPLFQNPLIQNRRPKRVCTVSNLRRPFRMPKMIQKTLFL